MLREAPALSVSGWARVADASAWFGVCLFLSGGFNLKGVYFGHQVVFELYHWGLAFFPLLLLVALGRSEWQDLTFVRNLHKLWPHLAKPHVYRSLSLGLCLWHGFAMYARHDSFASEWDLSIYANACANGLQSSLRNHTSLLADHFEPVLYFFVPLCRRLNPVTVLLTSQVTAWYLGSIAVRRLAIKGGWSQSLGTGVMLLYLLFAGNQTLSYYDFHPYSLSLATIPWLLLSMIDGQKFRALGFAILHLTLKENTSLFVAAFGCYLILTRQMRHFGGFLVLLGGLCFIVVMTQIFPYFRHGAESEYFAKYYGYLGHTMAEFVTKAVTQPWIPILEMLKPAKVLYLLTVFSPFALLPLLRPVTLLPIVPSLLIAVLSNIPEMYAASFHYEAEIYPWLFSSTVLIAYDETTTTRIQRVLKLWPQMVRHRPVSIWLGVMTVFFTGASPVWKLFYYAPSKHHLDLGVHLETLRKDLSGCKVASVERIAGHLASVEQLTMLPEHQSADAIVIAYPQGKRLWLTPFHVIEKEYAPMWDQNYKLIQPLDYDRDFRVWVRPPCRFPST